MGNEQAGDSPSDGNGSGTPSGVEGTAIAKRARLSPEAITAAAIAIADAEGLDAVSIRRVAAALGARPMSLYTHLSSKEELLASMAERGIEEMLIRQPLPEDWREAVAALARRMYGAYLAHPWHIRLFTQKLRFGPNATKLAKQQARAVASLRLEAPEVWLALGTVNDFVLGHSLRAVTVPEAEEVAKAISPTDVVEFPELSTLGDSVAERVTSDRFERGLEIMLDGIESRFLRGD